MFVKSFTFSKLAKIPDTMEKEINDFLRDVNFKFASHSESPSKGRLVVSIYYDLEAKGNVEATILKSGNVESLDKATNEVIRERDFKFATQSYSQGNLYSIIYTSKKVKNGSKKEK